MWVPLKKFASRPQKLGAAPSASQPILKTQHTFYSWAPNRMSPNVPGVGPHGTAITGLSLSLIEFTMA